MENPLQAAASGQPRYCIAPGLPVQIDRPCGRSGEVICSKSTRLHQLISSQNFACTTGRLRAAWIDFRWPRILTHSAPARPPGPLSHIHRSILHSQCGAVLLLIDPRRCMGGQRIPCCRTAAEFYGRPRSSIRRMSLSLWAGSLCMGKQVIFGHFLGIKKH